MTVAAELVANAITHSHSWVVTVELRTAHGVELVVTDEGGRPSHPHRCDDVLATHTHGRGLAIVDALASAWGVNGDEHGRSVWAWFLPQERA
ncbi:ATP-binding protein [Lipingzhangella halophila]|uniref:ATP-binding protein n=1 Tax=Lipingzhangella halophila TaxID=1783352 RepID=UPI0035E4253A